MNFDPRTRLVMVFSLSTLAVFLRDIYLLVVVLVTSITAVKILNGNFKFINKIKKLIFLFLGITVIQSIFTNAGSPILRVREVILLTTGGLRSGMQIILRMLIIVISATIMSGSSAREIVQGLIQWKIPYEIAFMVSLAIRFLPILAEEAKDAYNAVQLRGIELGKLSFKEKIKIYSYLFLPVISGVLVKARKISTAMEARAFRAYPQRTSYLQLKLKGPDYFIMFVSLAYFAVVMNIYLFV